MTVWILERVREARMRSKGDCEAIASARPEPIEEGETPVTTTVVGHGVSF